MTDLINLEGDSREVAGWVWRNLVPKSGQADTVQGELLRAVEKLCWEAQNNGNGNWDDRFEMLIEFLASTLTSEARLPDSVRDSVVTDLAVLRDYERPYLEDDLYDRLTEAVVEFCRVNPLPMKRAKNPDQYR